MELWVHSQDKEILIKTTDIRFNRKKDDYSILGYGDAGVYRLLGVYKTKERALKVLDEIQEAQLGNYHYRCPSNVKVSNNENTIVYQMPLD